MKKLADRLDADGSRESKEIASGLRRASRVAEEKRVHLDAATRAEARAADKASERIKVIELRAAAAALAHEAKKFPTLSAKAAAVEEAIKSWH